MEIPNIKKENTFMNINDIIVNELNPRVHTKLNVNMIKKSISKCGVIDNLIVDENNILLAGHGRLLALKDLGIKEVDVTKIFGLTEEQKKQYLVYSNRTTETSTWDGELLFEITDNLLKNDNDFLVGDFELEELINAYKVDEIEGFLNKPEIANKDNPIFITGIIYTNKTKEIIDFEESLNILKEKNNDIEIFRGKEIPNKK